MQRTAEYIRTHGVHYTLFHGWKKMEERYFHTYDRLWKKIAPDKKELEQQKAHQPWDGMISILVPVYRTDPGFLEDLFASFQAQSYPNFEVIAYVTGERAETDRVLEKWKSMDARIRVIRGAENLGISGNTNAASAYAQGSYLALCDHDDLLSPEALWQVARRIAATGADVIYTDEDKVSEDGRVHTDPHCKPDLCGINLLSSNYICHFLCMRRSLWEAVGGERSRFDGSQDHDLMLRLMEKTDNMEHIPMILYHWRTVGASMSHRNLQKCTELSRNAVQEYLDRNGGGSAWVDRDVVRFSFSVPEHASVDAVILENRPGEGKALSRTLERGTWKEIRVRTVPVGDDRYESMNRAAEESSSDLLLFMDASLKVDAEDLVAGMIPYAVREGTGFVAPCLVDRRGRITHAGFAVGGKRFLVCRQAHVMQKAGGWHLLLRQAHEVSAVSPACMMIRRDRFEPFTGETGGALRAVDLCLRLQKKGLRHICLPENRVICENGTVLGSEELQTDIEKLRKAWPGLRDRCWNPCYDPEKADGRLASAEIIRTVWRESREE